MKGALDRASLIKRLESYWKLEAFNVALVPAAIIYLTHLSGETIGLLSILAMIVMAVLLVVGSAYWRAKLRQVEGENGPLRKMLRWAARLKGVLALSSIAVFVAALASWFVTGLSVSLGDRIAASVAATLAVLEYVNYYHRQLQHFDHLADWQRLLTGKGFRRSQLASDLARMQNSR